MIRHVRYVSSAIAIALLAACGRDAVAPNARSADRPNLKVKTLRANATTADIVVMPSGGMFAIGKHSIKFPKHSICALNSSYGPTEWDKPCYPATGPVSFHVEIESSDGREWVKFTPEVRFVPTTRASEYVMLYMRSDNISTNLSEDELQILWSPSLDVPGIDESLADPTLRTKVSYGAGMLQRRVKHFSYYTIHDGDPPCVPIPDGPVCPPTGLSGDDQ